jgi:peptidoglycan hydrolase-like protein with peptidoglycan-binding domain
MIVLEGYGEYPECGTLRYGSRGKCVELLQTYLNATLSHAGITINVDGIFGSKTLEAIKFFQKSRGLSVDGIVGANTWSSLENEVNKIYGSGSVENIKSSIFGAKPVTITKPAVETKPEGKVPVQPVQAGFLGKTFLNLLLAGGIALIAWSIFGKE